MNKIYSKQESLRIRLTTGVDIAEATTTKIKYRKPDGTKGEWGAEVEDATKGIIYYDVKKTVSEADIDQAGVWKFWAYITFSDGRSAPGKVVKERIYSEGI